MIDSKPATTTEFRGIRIPSAAHPAIRKIKRGGLQPSIHGNKPWNSSRLLIDFLHRQKPTHTGSVIDVGCGWGMSGIWCAKVLGADVCSVDADGSILPYLQATAEINGVVTSPLISRFEQLTTVQLSQFDMLIAADICFWDELVKPVYNLVNRAVKAGVKHIYIADPERPTFHTMAELCARRHCADVMEWKTRGARSTRGAILAIENA